MPSITASQKAWLHFDFSNHHVNCLIFRHSLLVLSYSHWNNDFSVMAYRPDLNTIALPIIFCVAGFLLCIYYKFPLLFYSLPVILGCLIVHFKNQNCDPNHVSSLFNSLFIYVYLTGERVLWRVPRRWSQGITPCLPGEQYVWLHPSGMWMNVSLKPLRQKLREQTLLSSILPSPNVERPCSCMTTISTGRRTWQAPFAARPSSI